MKLTNSELVDSKLVIGVSRVRNHVVIKDPQATCQLWPLSTIVQISCLFNCGKPPIQLQQGEDPSRGFPGHCDSLLRFVDSSGPVCSPPRAAPPRLSAAVTPTPPSLPPRPTWGRRPGRAGAGRPGCSTPGSWTATGLRWCMIMTAACLAKMMPHFWLWQDVQVLLLLSLP